jgi:hypothetical protein
MKTRKGKRGPRPCNSVPMYDLLAEGEPRAIIKKHMTGRWSWCSIKPWKTPRTKKLKIIRITSLKTEQEAIADAIRFFQRHAGDRNFSIRPHQDDCKVENLSRRHKTIRDSHEEAQKLIASLTGHSTACQATSTSQPARRPRSPSAA